MNRAIESANVEICTHTPTSKLRHRWHSIQNRFVAALVSAMALLGAFAAAHAADKKPNIVVMMADNLGYGDLGIYGGLRAPTPRIDRLARANGAGHPVN